MRSSRPLVFLVVALALGLAPAAMAATPVQSYIVTCNASCASVAAAVAQIPGAKVDRSFQNVAGVVVTLPVTAVTQIQSRPDVATISKDVVLGPPSPDRIQHLPAAASVQALAPAQLKTLAGGSPADYGFNNQLIGASTFQAQGKIGSGVVVAVIDSGIANNPSVVPAIAGSVLGGESFLTPAQDPVTSATSTLNGLHGTWVSTVIAGHVVFLFDANSSLVQALNLEAPGTGSVIPCSLLGCPSTLAGVPMVGVAPGASLYAFKIFPSFGGGAPVSLIAAAMDRAITLRKNFNNGMPAVPTNPGCGAEDNPCVYNSLPIQVVNMSLGGLTLFAGQDVEDQLGKEMLKAGIVLVTASGNSGPGAMTSESPATGAGALSAAASSTAPHERVLWDVTFGVGAGPIVRPFSGIQTASFSSRGPSAEGRTDIDLSANGFATFAQGADGSISLVSGTSFASPTIAGAAALLRESFPAASATKIRNALSATGNPALITDGSKPIDRGSGLLDIPAAAAKLSSGNVSTTLPAGLGTPSVLVNLLPLGIFPINFVGDHYVKHLSNLIPGQTVQLFVPTAVDTAGLTVSLQNVTLAPPAQQNQFVGDAIFLTVLDAPTSAAATLVSQFLVSDASFPVSLPQSGLVRVAVAGSTNNAAPVSADVVIDRQRVNPGPPISVGTVKQGDQDVVQFQVPPGKSQLSVVLSWLHDWGAYPTNDLDVVLVDPNGNVDVDGATLNSPERAVIANPTPGVWTAYVQGFQINQGIINNQDLWVLRVNADGQPLKRLH
jgi:hypothetical protein